jgi:hypothetical protein
MMPSKINFATVTLSIAVALVLVSHHQSEARLPVSTTNPVRTASQELASSLPIPANRMLEPPIRDPFGTSVNAPQPIVAAAIKASEPIAPVAPTAPPLNIRFEGRMTSPSGEQLVFASDGVTSTTLTVGHAFSNGYIVKSMDDKAVEFEYPPLGTTTRIDLPPEPRQEIR